MGNGVSRYSPRAPRRAAAGPTSSAGLNPETVASVRRTPSPAVTRPSIAAADCRAASVPSRGVLRTLRTVKHRRVVPDMRNIMERDASSLHDRRERPVELWLARNHARDTIGNGWLDRDERHPAPLGFADESIELPEILLQRAGIDALRRIRI